MKVLLIIAAVFFLIGCIPVSVLFRYHEQIELRLSILFIKIGILPKKPLSRKKREQKEAKQAAKAAKKAEAKAKKKKDAQAHALIAKLEASPLSAEWRRFRAMDRTLRAPAPPDSRPWRQIPAKKRRIDPRAEGLGRVSAVDPGFSADLDAFLCQPQTVWLLAE